jgi:hypothetical protein
METKVLVPIGAILIAVLGGMLFFSHKRSPPPEYRAALEKWNSLQMRDYKLRIEERCQFSCIGPVLISVRGGQVVDARPGDPSAQWWLTASEIRNRPTTIEGIFAAIAEAYAEPSDVLDVVYDPRLGYPTKAIRDESKSAIDDEWSIEVVLTEVPHGA